MAEANAGYTLRVGELAGRTGETTAVINRFREKDVIPPQLCQKQDAGTKVRYFYKEEAVRWVLFAQKFRPWRTTEGELGEFFRECLQKCGGDTAKTLAALERAFSGSANFGEVKSKFSCK